VFGSVEYTVNSDVASTCNYGIVLSYDESWTATQGEVLNGPTRMGK